MSGNLEVLSAPETAALLHKRLGPVCAWDDWLSDRRRDRGNQLADFDLQPCAYIQERCKRPLYALADVVKFILSYLRRHPDTRPRPKPRIRLIEFDTADRRSWKMRPPAHFVSRAFTVTI